MFVYTIVGVIVGTVLETVQNHTSNFSRKYDFVQFLVWFIQ